MVTVTILSILILIALPTLNTARDTARQRTCWANQRTVEAAYQIYVTEYEAGEATVFPDWPSLMTALVGARILREPHCPGGGGYSWDGQFPECTAHGRHP